MVEKVYTATERVCCNGGDDTGHPKVYLDASKTGTITCPYCSKTYIYNQP